MWSIEVASGVIKGGHQPMIAIFLLIEGFREPENRQLGAMSLTSPFSCGLFFSARRIFYSRSMPLNGLNKYI